MQEYKRKEDTLTHSSSIGESSQHRRVLRWRRRRTDTPTRCTARCHTCTGPSHTLAALRRDVEEDYEKVVLPEGVYRKKNEGSNFIGNIGENNGEGAKRKNGKMKSDSKKMKLGG